MKFFIQRCGFELIKAKFAGLSMHMFVASTAMLGHNIEYWKASLTAMDIGSKGLQTLNLQDTDCRRHSMSKMRKQPKKEDRIGYTAG